MISLLMSEKRIDAVSLSFLWPPHPPLSLRCEWGEARWVAMSEGMQQWGRRSFISQWKVYFSLVNRHGCISLSLTPPSPSQSPSSFSFHFSVSFLSLPPPFSLSLSASYLELYRGQIEGIIFLRLSFSAMRWYWRSHSAPVSKINQKHFFTAAINALALFQQLYLFLSLTLRHTSPPSWTHTLFLLCFFLRRWFSLERWHQIASLQQSTPLGGICISFASHYRFNRANCAPFGEKMTRGEVERWR